ncbi:hypothetical protein B0H14DRAFT_2633998 [Mycena olivaceomarginata]|nr:hypothetical protein B0H14DRAFT_2633998 [Mycena olivaceomarginata]
MSPPNYKRNHPETCASAARNQKAREKRQANKRKAASESESNDAYEPEPEPNSDTAEREAECDSHPDEAQLSDSFGFPTPADLVPKRRSCSRKRQALDTVANTGTRRTCAHRRRWLKMQRIMGPNISPEPDADLFTTAITFLT